MVLFQVWDSLIKAIADALSHERMIRTLNRWGVSVDEAFFLGGIEKKRILEVMKPHIYFDDQQENLDHIDNIPLVHVPFGIMNDLVKQA